MLQALLKELDDNCAELKKLLDSGDKFLHKGEVISEKQGEYLKVRDEVHRLSLVQKDIKRRINQFTLDSAK